MLGRLRDAAPPDLLAATRRQDDIDRLLHSATVLNIQGRSYRLRDLEAGLNRVHDNGIAQPNAPIDRADAVRTKQVDLSTQTRQSAEAGQ